MNVGRSVSLCALLLAAACSGEASPPPELSAAEVADLVSQKDAADCPAVLKADGWLETTTNTKSKLKATSQNVEIVDRHARRTSSRRLTRSGDSDSSFLAGSKVNGTFYGCFSPGSNHCTLGPLDRLPEDLSDPSTVTLAYIQFNDFDQPSHGGAATAFDPAPSDVEGAAWKLSVTPKGGLPYTLHVAADGSTLAIDIPWLKQRTTNLEWQAFNGCRVPSKTRLNLSADDYQDATVTNFDVRPTMTPADTPTEGEAAMP